MAKVLAADLPHSKSLLLFLARRAQGLEVESVAASEFGRKGGFWKDWVSIGLGAGAEVVIEALSLGEECVEDIVFEGDVSAGSGNDFVHGIREEVDIMLRVIGNRLDQLEIRVCS